MSTLPYMFAVISETKPDSLNIYKIPVFEQCTSLVEQDLVLADFKCTIWRRGVLVGLSCRSVFRTV